jgi:hypothetical protein
MISDREIEIGRFLTQKALEGRRTTYRELGQAIQWYHPTGRGLGKHLRELSHFTRERGYPCLSSILCVVGTSRPIDGAVEFIRQVYGPIDIGEEQNRVFNFDWRTAQEFGFEQPVDAEIDFDRIYATRTWGFDPKSWGMISFSHEGTRESVLAMMGGKPIFVISFCSQNAETIDAEEGRQTIAPEDLARVLGITEVQPIRASHETHSAPNVVSQMITDWGKLRWPFGLASSRAWEIVERPWTREALPNARSISWEATRSIVALTDEEKRLIRQYRLREVPVFGQLMREVAVAVREQMHTTYLAVCEDQAVLAKTNAPPGTRLVKIGVSGDTDRRLRDLNDHHFAKIFGLGFRMFATQRWSSQDEALGRETDALEWALENAALHASGEYFFMTPDQVNGAMLKVKPPRRVR